MIRLESGLARESALNDFPLRPRVLNLSLTERCTAACRMCVTESSPTRCDAEIDEDRALAWVEAASHLEGLIAICFIGGEPFLRLPTLERLTRHASELGLMVSAVTNCFWAKSRRTASRVMDRLRAAGLTRVTVSTDSFHTEFIPLSFVDNAIAAAHDHGVLCNLNCVVAPGSERLADFLQRLSAADLIDHVEEFSCLPVGRGADMELPGAPEMPYGPCGLVVSTLSVKPNGDVYACCGVGGFTPPLRLGSLYEESLDTLVSRAVEDPLILAMAIHGPKWLADQVPDDLELPDQGFIDNCHLCHSLLGDEIKAKAIREALLHKSDLLSAQHSALRKDRIVP